MHTLGSLRNPSSIEPLEKRIAPAVTLALDLANVPGREGIRIEPEAGQPLYGGIRGVGDFNGDGLDDFLLGGQTTAYLVFGRSAGFDSTLDLAEIDGENGFSIKGDYVSVSKAGDVNGDHLADLIVGFSGDYQQAGKSYVIFGHTGPAAKVFYLSFLDGTNGFAITDGGQRAFSRASIEAAGDLNGDGFGDLVLGGPSTLADPIYEPGPAATGYVIYGHAGAFAPSIKVSELNGTNGSKIRIEGQENFPGAIVGGAGDVNGDGFADLLIRGGRFGEAPPASYVVYGRASGFGAEYVVSTLDDHEGFRILNDPAATYSNILLGGIGDLNGDGFDDFIIETEHPGPYTLEHVATPVVIFGKAHRTAPELSLAHLSATDGFRITGAAAEYGIAFSGAGDVNGDGLDDLVLGARYGSPNGSGSGTGYVVFGRASGFPSTLDLSRLQVNEGLELFGGVQNSGAGDTVSGAGDVNHDGFADFLISASTFPPGGAFSAGAYLIYGQAQYLDTPLDVKTRSVSYLEPDGDRVTVSVDKGSLADEHFTLVRGEGGLTLHSLAVNKTSAKHATLSAKLTGAGSGAGAGDFAIGRVQVDDGVALSRLLIAGDVTRLDVSPTASVDLVRFDSLGKRRADFPGLAVGVGLKGDVHRLEFRGDVDGATLEFSSALDELRVGGDFTSSTLFTDHLLGAIRVSGSVIGSHLHGIGPAHPKSQAQTTVFGKVVIQGDLADSEILAGYNEARQPIGLGSIGLVSVGGKLRSSDIVAGGVAGADGVFGTPDDAAISVAEPYVSTLGRVFIKSAPEADGAPGQNHGIVAQNIGALQIGNHTVALKAGRGNDSNPQRVGAAPDTYFRELNSAVVVNFNLANLNGQNGFTIQGAEGDFTRVSVSSAGDVNGDGYADIIIGASREATATSPGASYVIFGRPGGFGPILNVAMLDGSNGFKIVGEAAGDLSGISVSGAGDIDGDGYSDLVIGAQYRRDFGAVYVVYGQPEFEATVALSALNGDNGFKITPKYSGTEFGSPVSGAGDVNHDGYDDLIIGPTEDFPDGTFIDTSYVVFGAPRSHFGAVYGLGSLDAASGLQIQSEQFFFGSVSRGGDLNGDGFADVILSAIDGTYVIFGAASFANGVVKVSTLDGTNGFRLQPADRFSSYISSITSAGDVNGDGVGDLLIGDSFADFRVGAAYVLFGTRNPFGAVVDLGSLNGSNGFKIRGEGYFDYAGTAVNAAGDINGDGFDDVIVSGDSGINHHGPVVTYVVFGHGGGFDPTFDLASLNGTNGYKILSEQGYTGNAVSGAGDINGDGFADLVLGPLRDTVGPNFVVFGSPAVQIDARTIAYTEADGDHVLLQVDKGSITTGSLQFKEVSENRYLVQTLDLSADGLQDADVSVHVVSSGGALAHGSGFAAAAVGNIGIPNIGNVILPDHGGPATVDIEGNVQHVEIPQAAKLKEFKVLSLGADTDLFPGIPRKFEGAGTVVKVTVLHDVTDYVFDIPGAVDQMTVGGSIHGSTLSFAQSLSKLTVKGSVETSTLNFTKSAGTIHVGSLAIGDLLDSDLHIGGKLGQLVVEGKISGADISVLGTLNPKNAGQALALGKLTVGGDVEASHILAGYDAGLLPMNVDAQIGAVRIAGVLRASDLVAGATRGPDGRFGTGDDELPQSGRSLVARIASIVLGGVEGTADAGDNFGIVAEQIGSLKVGAAKIPLGGKVGDDVTPHALLSGTTNDFFVREVNVTQMSLAL